MISAQNHLQLLSGSKYIILFFITAFILSCGSSKQLPSKRPQVVQGDKNDDAPKNNSSKVDTMDWTKMEDQKNPPIVNESPTTKNVPATDIKSAYKVALFMPFNAKNYTSTGSADETYIQYYAGMKLAAQNMKSNGVNVTIDVVDASNNRSLTADDSYDLIIAPNDKNTVSDLIDYGRKTQTLVISPWYSNSKITEDNPYYLQLRPNLKEHFKKIAEHVSQNFTAEEVALVGLDQKSYKSWFNFFQENAMAYYSSKPKPFMEHFVKSDSLALGERVFANQIEQGIKVFIVPNYSFKDEDHVYSVLRRLNAEKGMHKIYVYGMPLMIDSDKINFDYYNNLNIKIAVSDFLDDEKYEVNAFRSDYFNTYGSLPTKDAYEGHDLVKFISDAISEYGNHFPPEMNGGIKTYLQTSFDIRGVNADDENLDASAKVDFYENKHLNIIEFRDGKFRKSR